MRIVIVGFDGLDYYRVMKYIDQLPTFKKLKNFIGRLESTIPPSTAPAWVSMFTGKTPDEHGIYGFVNVETRKVMNYSDIRSEKLWTILDDLRFCIVNLPMTYPPEKNINGVIVSGFPTYTNDLSKIVYPQEWIQILKKIHLPRDIDEIEFRRKYNNNKEGAFKYILTLMDKRAEAYLKLLEFDEFDIFWFVFRETDIVQHFYRDERKIIEIYRKADEILSKFLRKIKEEDWLIVVSDHGHYTVENVVYVDNLLTKILGIKLTKIAWLSEKLLKYTRKYHRVIQKIMKDKEIIKYEWLQKEKLFTYNPDSWTVVLDEKIEEKSKYIIDRLKETKYNNKPVFINVFHREEIYPNSKITLPDIFLLPNYGFQLMTGLKFGENKKVIDIPRDPSHNGTHTLDGVHILYSKSREHIDVPRAKKIHEILNEIISIYENY